MNKETIYIEPSDDITDILSRLKASDKKVIALVPPKKPTVLLSSVNIKLISRAAKSGKKAIVLVTTDDSLTKLAMTANLPVAPSLKSRPIMPGEEKPSAAAKKKEEADESAEDEDSHEEMTDQLEDFEDGEEEPEGPEEADDEEEPSEDEEAEEDTDEEAENEEEPETDEDEEDEEDKDETPDADDEEEAEDEKDKRANKKKEEKAQKVSDKSKSVDADKKSSKKSDDKAKESDKKPRSGFIGFVAQHKFWVIGGVSIAVCLVAFLFWAFTIAPRVSVSIFVRTSSSNFSENVTFTKNSADEDSAAGLFYLHEEKIENEQTIKFTATGKKDLGESASGELVLLAYFTGPGSASVPAGSTFSHGTLSYTTLSDITLVGPSDNKAKTFKATCDNYSDDFEIGVDYCQVSAAVSVKAVAPGEDYNLSATNEGWASSVKNISAYNRSDITGGTSNIVTVIQQSDVDLALDKLKSDEAGNKGSKEELYGKLSDTAMPVEASFKVTTSDPQITPAVGEEVKEGVTPQISTKTTHSVYTIDRVRVEEYIKSKAFVEEGKRLYSYGEPFIEYFAEAGSDTYTGKLKTTYKAGPQISETDVLDKIRGEKIGRIKPILVDAFPGVSDVKADKSYFWVNSVPSNENKVEIKITIDEENENK